MVVGTLWHPCEVMDEGVLPCLKCDNCGFPSEKNVDNFVSYLWYIGVHMGFCEMGKVG